MAHDESVVGWLRRNSFLLVGGLHMMPGLATTPSNTIRTRTTNVSIGGPAWFCDFHA